MKGRLSIRETSCRRGGSERRINRYAAEGCIPGAERFGRSRAIPSDAGRPVDPRRLRKAGNQSLPVSVSGGAGSLGVYRQGSQYKKESLQFFKACVGDDGYTKAMNGDAGRTHHHAAARAFPNRTNRKKSVRIGEYGSPDGFRGQ